jgi:hypothetical protein
MIRLHQICAFAAALLASGAVRANDFDLQTTPSRPSADFSGVGLGVDAGVGLGSTGGGNASGAIGGAHVGYNFQASRLVGGAEADFLTSGIKSGTLGANSFQQNFLSSARVKTGWAFGDLLAYGTIGWAYSTAKFTDATGTQALAVKQVQEEGVSPSLGNKSLEREVCLKYTLVCASDKLPNHQKIWKKAQDLPPRAP